MNPKDENSKSNEVATLRGELQQQWTEITAMNARMTDISNTLNALTDTIRGMTNPPVLTRNVRRDTNDSSLEKDKKLASSTHSELEPSHNESTQVRL